MTSQTTRADPETPRRQNTTSEQEQDTGADAGRVRDPPITEGSPAPPRAPPWEATGGHDAPPVVIGKDATGTHSHQDRKRRTALRKSEEREHSPRPEAEPA